MFQETPLHIAVRQRDLETVRTLLGQGVDTNIKDKDGVNKTDGRLMFQLSSFIIFVQVCNNPLYPTFKD